MKILLMKLLIKLIL